jgi:indole-3-glycerol phosphate synthase
MQAAASRRVAPPMPDPGNPTPGTPGPGNPDSEGPGGAGAQTGPTLDTIIARKRIEVAKAKVNTPIQTLQVRCAQLEPARNFFAAVVNTSGRGRRQVRIIAEIKRRSPSAGVIRDEFRGAGTGAGEGFSPVRIATAYAEAGAAALSVLTDEEYFGGHLGYIQQVREAVPLPVLRKDFIVDEYQIWESRAANADAVLLIADVIPEAELLDMMILARELGMTTLVEAHEVETLLKVRRHIGFPHAGYSLLGINNRDLRTMRTDLTHTFRMAEMVEDKRVLVSESGIKTHADLVKLRQHGVYIALVGESLLKQPDPGKALRELIGT